MTTSGITALMAASQRDHVEVVTALLGAGGKLELLSSDGRTALAIAAQYGAVDSIRALLARGANPNGGCAAPPRRLLLEGGVPNTPERIPCAAGATRSHGHGHGCSALPDSLSVDDPGNPDHAGPAPAVVSSSPADPTKPCLASPAVKPSSTTEVDAVPVLADCSRYATDQACPVVLAARRGHIAALRLLVRHGADPNPRLKDGRPLLLACVDGFSTGTSRVLVRSEVVAALLTLGANPATPSIPEGFGSVDEEVSRCPAAILSATTDRALQRVWAEFQASLAHRGGGQALVSEVAAANTSE